MTVDDMRFAEQVELLQEAQQTVHELLGKLERISEKMFQVYHTAKYEEYKEE